MSAREADRRGLPIPLLTQSAECLTRSTLPSGGGCAEFELERPSRPSSLPRVPARTPVWLGQPPKQVNRIFALAPCGDVTRGGGIPGAALRRYASGMIDREAIRKRWESVGCKLGERERRMFAAAEVQAAGWGGLEAVSQITGLARSTLGRGKADLVAPALPKGRVRRAGGGRQPLSQDATVMKDMRSLVEPATLGDPMRPLLWVSKSHDKLALALQGKGTRSAPAA